MYLLCTHTHTQSFADFFFVVDTFLGWMRGEDDKRKSRNKWIT